MTAKTKKTKRELQAAAIGRKINALLRQGFQLEKNKYIRGKDCGCAIFATAVAVGACDATKEANLVDEYSHTSVVGKRLRAKLLEWGLDLRDVLALEIGFEKDWGPTKPAKILTNNPFFKLGQQLRTKSATPVFATLFEVGPDEIDVLRKGERSDHSWNWLP